MNGLRYSHRHVLADPLIDAVEDLDIAIANLRTVEIAMSSPAIGETFDLRPILETMNHAVGRVVASRDVANNTAAKILDGGADA